MENLKIIQHNTASQLFKKRIDFKLAAIKFGYLPLPKSDKVHKNLGTKHFLQPYLGQKIKIRKTKK